MPAVLRDLEPFVRAENVVALRTGTPLRNRALTHDETVTGTPVHGLTVEDFGQRVSVATGGLSW